jgi:hypothetical protein
MTRSKDTQRLVAAIEAISRKKSLSSNEFAYNLFFALRRVIEGRESYIREYGTREFKEYPPGTFLSEYDAKIKSNLLDAKTWLSRKCGDRQGYHAPDDWQVGAALLSLQNGEIADILENTLKHGVALPKESSDRLKKYGRKRGWYLQRSYNDLPDVTSHPDPTMDDTWHYFYGGQSLCGKYTGMKWNCVGDIPDNTKFSVCEVCLGKAPAKVVR